MNVEIISIGDELLIGQTVNTNASWIGKELSYLGARIVKTISISDQKKEILEGLSNINPVPISSSPLFNSSYIDTIEINELDQTDFSGAFSNENWLKGWSVLSAFFP